MGFILRDLADTIRVAAAIPIPEPHSCATLCHAFMGYKDVVVVSEIKQLNKK